MSEELEEIQAEGDALDLGVTVCQVGRFVFVVVNLKRGHGHS